MRRTTISPDAASLHNTFLSADDDPVLAQLWDNDDDRIFDNLYPGDIILVPFKFADSDLAKLRPAVIVSAPSYQASRSNAP